MRADHERRSRLSARLSVAVAALAVTALGLGGSGPLAVVGVAGALAFGWGFAALDATRYVRQAAGSVAVVIGGLAMLASVSWAPGIAAWLTAAFGVAGLAVVAIGATGGVPDERVVLVRAALGVSLFVLVAGGCSGSWPGSSRVRPSRSRQPSK